MKAGLKTFAVAALGFFAATAFGDTVLMQDEDWTGQEATKLTGKIDLNGHTLTVSTLVGTCTITNGTPMERYERLEYIESTGTQYIDTGVTPTASTKIRLEFGNFSLAADRTSSALFSAGEWGRTHCMLGMIGYNGRLMFNGADNYYFDDCGTTKLPGRYTFTLNETKGVVSLAQEGGVTTTLSSCDTTVKNVVGIRLFACPLATLYPSKYKLYSMQIRTGEGVLQRDFVPVRRVRDGAVGLLDLANFGLNEFYVRQGTGEFTAGAVTGAITGGGELHVNVGSGKTVENTTVALTGSLKFVKEGEGTFVSINAPQTYTGGTDVRGGTVRLGGSSYLGAAYAPITVYEGAVLDIGEGGNRKWMRPVLAGGTLVNSGVGVASTAEQNSVIVLTDDSFINFTQNGGMVGSGYSETTLDLGGHELDLTVASGRSFWLLNATVTVGRVKFSGEGTLAITSSSNGKATSLRAAAADFDLAGKVTVAVPAEVHDWTVRPGATVSGDGTITVNGTFRPDGDSTAKYTLQGGATLDLGGKTAAWACGALAFANGATITVVPPSRSEKIIDWMGHAPDGSVTFRLPDGVKGLLVVKDDGLYFYRGLIITFM